MKILIILLSIMMCSACTKNPPQNETVEQAQEAPIELDEIDQKILTMTTEQKIGQILMPRLPGQTQTINAATREIIQNIQPGGFVFFGTQINTIEQVQKLARDLQDASEIPLFISIDEEGGRVSRINKLYTQKTPTALSIGQTNNTQNAFEHSQRIAQRLRNLGVNMNFAPIADIWSNPNNRVIGDRAYATTPEATAQMVEAAVRGYKDSGVLSVIKHFPGHGDTTEDSHDHIAIYGKDKQHFDQNEAIPFRSGIDAGTDAVMLGHIATPMIKKTPPAMSWMNDFNENGHLPATLSELWMRDILRAEMGFEGLIVTDALEMGAMTTNFDFKDVAIGAFLAGADILLIPIRLTETYEALIEACQQGIITEQRLNESVRRILKAKQAIKQW